MKFFHSDNPNNGWKGIGVSGSEIEVLSNGAFGGYIIYYDYVPGNNEMVIDISGTPELGDLSAKYMFRVSGGSYTIKKYVEKVSVGFVLIAEGQWQETKQGYYTQKRLLRLQSWGCGADYSCTRQKQFTPRNVIRQFIEDLVRYKEMHT